MSELPLDRVRIDRLVLNCIIGINPWARLAPQPIELDVTLHADLASAGRSDNIDETVNYRTIAKRLVEMVEGSSFGLVEALAEAAADICLEDERVRRVDVSLRKPGAVRHAEAVGVEISRGR